MKSHIVLFFSALVLVVILVTQSFSVPQLLWPQKDIGSSSVNATDIGKKVLIASRYSVFKAALVDKIKQELAADSVSVRCTGLSRISRDDTARYSAVVLVNTCMAWAWDRNVDRLLRGKKDAANVIVITTSGSGKWLPKRNPAGVDAVACASVKAGPDALVGDIVKKVKAILERK
jgi:hypothetical protein